MYMKPDQIIQHAKISVEVKTMASNGSDVEKEGEMGAIHKSSGVVVFGDLLWVKLHGSSWWPAQVVDEKAVSGCNKPSEKSSGDVLVRLYGSYEYLYVDCNKYRVEFERVLEENNGIYSEIFIKSLEEDLRCVKSGRAKQKGSKSKEEAAARSTERVRQLSSRKKLFDTGTPRRASSRLSDARTQQTKVKKDNLLSEKPENTSKKRKHDSEKKLEPSTPKSATSSAGKSQVLIDRKVKVMQSLGLTAPSGSPFRQSGFLST